MTGRGLRIGKNALALFVAQVGTRGLGLLLGAQLIRSLGTAGLGRYLLALTTEGLALAVADWGFNILATRELSLEHSVSEAEEILGGILGLKLLTSVACVAGLNFLFAPWLFPGARRTLIAIVSVALVPDALNGAMIAWLKARQRMEVSSLVEVGMRLFSTVGGIGFLLRGYDERAVLAAYSMGSLGGTVALGGILCAWHVIPRFRRGRHRWHGLLRQSLPFAVTGVVALLYRRMDFMLLSYWQGDVAAGIYGAAYRLWETLGILPTSFLDALFPELARLGDGSLGMASFRKLYQRGRGILLGIIGLIVLPFWLLASPGMALLYGEMQGLNVAVSVFRILLLVLPFTYLYFLHGHVLYALQAQRQVTRWMVVVTLLNGVLNAILIPLWGIWGTVGVAVLSEMGLFAALRLAAYRAFSAPLSPDLGEEHLRGELV